MCRHSRPARWMSDSDRRQVTHHEVEVQVKRRLDHLSRHYDPSCPADAGATEATLHHGFMRQSVGHRKSRVQ